MKALLRCLALVTSASVSVAGCHEPLDTTRTSVDTGTFGQTVVTLVCKRIAYLEDLADGGTTDVRGDTYRDICRNSFAPPETAPGSLKALLAKSEDLAAAVDTTFPDPFLPTLQAYLTSTEFLATYDREGGTAVPAIDSLIGLMRMFADDDEAIAALARLNLRLGYRPLEPALGAVRAAVRYPELHDLILALTQAITPGGSARAEWDNLVAALGVTLRNTEPSATDAERADPERTAAIAVDLLLGERPELGTTKTIPLVRRDPRGVAAPATFDMIFADGDGDGLADLDPEGRYVDSGGQVVDAPAPFLLPEGVASVPWQYRDPEGRALTAEGGTPLYRYIDVDKTVLSALARDGVQLFDPARGTALDLLRGASALMGPRVEATRTYDNGETLTYRGYQLEDAALLDMTHGFLQVLRDPNLLDTLDLARVLLTDREPEVARLAEAIVTAARLGDAHPEATIPADAPLWDDLMPVIREVLARPALVTALFRALERPEVKALGDRFHDYMTYKDRFDIDPSSQAVVGDFVTAVDRGAVDNAFNRSVFQRLLHLIHDSNGAAMCNKQDAQVHDPFLGIPLATYDECELVTVPNLAVFYVQSIAYARSGSNFICEDDAGDQTITTPDPQVCLQRGEHIRPKANFAFNWGGTVEGALDLMGGDAYLEEESTIDGFRTHPTPQALNRVLFLQPMPQILADTMDPARDKDGDLFNDQHVGTLPVWELEGFYDQIRPIVQAFADHNAEQLFVDFLSVLHKHWPSADSITHQTVDPNAPGYVWGSGALTYEPLIAEILAQRSLLDTLVDIAPVLNGTTVNGKSYMTIARQAATFLVSPLPGLANRAGETTSTTADGRPVDTLSPWQLLADAYAGKRARMEASGAEGQAWTESIREVVDVLVRGHDVPTVGWRFRNPRFRGVSLALLELVRARIVRHDQLGDRADWLATELPADLEEVLTSPVLAGAADFVLSLQAAPETRVHLDALMHYLVDEVTHEDAFRTTVTATADLLQLAIADHDLAPLARLAGRALAEELPDGRTWLQAQLEFVRAAREADAERALSQIVVNLFEETVPGRTAVGDLIDGISEVHRARPYEDLSAPYTGDDYRALFRGLADFLDEEKRGLRKFIGIIQDRNQ